MATQRTPRKGERTIYRTRPASSKGNGMPVSKEGEVVWIDTNAALNIVNRSPRKGMTRTSLYVWLDKYAGLGKKSGGRWVVNKARLLDILGLDK